MKYTIKEIFDLEELKHICESFTEINKTVTAILDLEGNVLVATGWQPICTQFHRINKETSKGCNESDTILAGQLKKGEKYNVYKCKNGLIDVAIPIIIENQHVANFFTGQFFTEKPDLEFFRKQAKHYGFDESEYIAAIENAPIFSEEQIKKSADFLVKLTETIGKIGLENLRNIEQKKLLEIEQANLRELNEEFAIVNEEFKAQNEELQLKNIELQLAKERAEKSEQHYQRLAQTAPIILYDYILYPDGINKFLYVGQGCYEILELEPDEMIADSNSFWKIVHPDDVLRLQNDDATANKRGDFFVSEFRITTKSGKTKWIQAASRPNPTINDEPAIWSGYIQDFTEKKQQEQELIAAKEKAEENEERFRKFFEQSLIGFALTSLEKGWLEVNETVCNYLGYSKEELFQKTWAELTHPEDLELDLFQFNQLIKGEISGYKMDKRFIHKNGDVVFTELSVRCRNNSEGKPEYFLALINNISERKHLELDLINAKKKAEESDRLKTAFLQNMSHEIRTPLNAISGFVGMLNKPELSEEKRKSFVSIIQNSSKQLVSIVSDILTISSLETRQEKANIDKVCINNIIIDLLAIFKQQAQNQNIALYAKQQLKDRQSEIYTDKTKITQILTNLLTNALKFTHEGFIEFGYNLKSDIEPVEMEFYVKDSGIGIKPEFHEKIFERFRQADKSINKLYGGTGLGLAISKAFVELLGGKIWVQSEPEDGATFYFTIPYKPVNQIDIAITPTKQNESFKTILVAEDEEYNFLFIEELLIDMDLNIIHAKDGKETVEIVKSTPNIDLILMDIKMPIMTGHEAAKIIKEINPDIPIVAQSAYALEHERAKYEKIFDDYLTKPLDENRLIQKVMKYIKMDKDK